MEKKNSISGFLSLLLSFIVLSLLAFALFGFEDPIEPLESGNIEKAKEQ